MKKNILITTGGSGGHVIPAMILHDHLSKDFNVTISTDKRGLRYLDKDNYNYNIIDTPKLNNIFFFTFWFNFYIIFNFQIIFFIKK